MSWASTPKTFSSVGSYDSTLTTNDSPSLGGALSTTVLSRCWPVLICSCIWSSGLCVLNYFMDGKVSIQPTLITVLGTVLGFVISFRTTSSFERYNEGRRLWSQIVLSCRTFARVVWFHIPENAVSISTENSEKTEQEQVQTLIEKKTVVNLLEAYAVSVKHYLRGEDGIYYDDLYPLVSFLSSSSYLLPAIIPSANPQNLHRRSTRASARSHRSQGVPGPPASPASTTHAPASLNHLSTVPSATSSQSSSQTITINRTFSTESSITMFNNEEFLLPAQMPPRNSWRAIFPFSFFLWVWATVRNSAGKKVVGVMDDNPYRAFRRSTNNVPLEISLYLSSYISALQGRKTVEAPTTTVLYATLNQLVDALTGLERILTTPIPISYSSHLWVVTLVYCTALPFQLWSTLRWFTIPASVITSFIFFGFVVAGEEIENPFGYDKNDLNMDHFVQHVIRKELRAITAMPAPNPAIWAFSDKNNFLGSLCKGMGPNETPTTWLHKEKSELLAALHGQVV